MSSNPKIVEPAGFCLYPTVSQFFLVFFSLLVSLSLSPLCLFLCPPSLTHKHAHIETHIHPCTHTYVHAHTYMLRPIPSNLAQTHNTSNTGISKCWKCLIMSTNSIEDRDFYRSTGVHFKAGHTFSKGTSTNKSPSPKTVLKLSLHSKMLNIYWIQTLLGLCLLSSCEFGVRLWNPITILLLYVYVDNTWKIFRVTSLKSVILVMFRPEIGKHFP